MWEIFHPRIGTPIYVVPFRIIARLICYFNPRLDYARKGKGWV